MFSIAETEAQREGSSHLSSSGDIAVSQAAARGPRPEEVDPGAGLSSAASCSDGIALSPRRPAPQPLAPRGSRATETWLVRLTDGVFHFISE